MRVWGFMLQGFKVLGLRVFAVWCMGVPSATPGGGGFGNSTSRLHNIIGTAVRWNLMLFVGQRKSQYPLLIESSHKAGL